MTGDTSQAKRVDPLRPIFDQMVAGHPTAPLRLYEALATGVVQNLRPRFGGLIPREVIADLVTDAVLALVTNPAAYDPARASLNGYVTLIVRRRLIDRLRRQTAAGGDIPILSLESVVQEDPSAKMVLVGADPAAAAADDPEAVALAQGRDPIKELPPEVEALLAVILPDPRDRELLHLLGYGRLTVDAFTRLYGVEDHPLEERQAMMKQNRERVVKRMQRRREEIWRRLREDE